MCNAAQLESLYICFCIRPTPDLARGASKDIIAKIQRRGRVREVGMRARHNSSHPQPPGLCMADTLVASDVTGIKDKKIGGQKGATERPDQTFVVKLG
jgi:hypothetical protein